MAARRRRRATALRRCRSSRSRRAGQIPGVAVMLETPLPLLVMPLVPRSRAVVPASGRPMQGLRHHPAAIDGFVRPAYARLHRRMPARSTAHASALRQRRRRTSLDAARQSFRRCGRRLVDCRDHPLRADHGAQPAGAHAVLAGPQGHRPEAGAGGARRQGSDRRRRRRSWRARASPCKGSARWNSCCYGDGAEALAGKDDPYRCAYGAAIAGQYRSHRRRGRRGLDKPDGFAALWANPGPATRSTATAPKR